MNKEVTFYLGKADAYRDMLVLLDFNPDVNIIP